MSHFKHQHILQLLGVCLDNDPQFIIMELMEGGDLLTYLRSSRKPTVLSFQFYLLIFLIIIILILIDYILEQHSPTHSIRAIKDVRRCRYRLQIFRGDALRSPRSSLPQLSSLLDGSGNEDRQDRRLRVS